jgi:hypothetical protein
VSSVVMIAIQLRPRHGRAVVGAAVAAALVVAAAFVVRAWPAPRPLIMTIEAERPTYVPLSGYQWRDRGDEQCLAFLAEWVEHPGWTLRLDRGVSGCTGEYRRDGVSIDGAGRVSWIDEDGRARATVLPEREFAELLAAAHDSCVEPVGEDRVVADAMVSAWIDVSWAGGEDGDLRLHASPAFARLDAVIERVGEDYRDHRLAARGRFNVETTLAADAWPLVHARPLRISLDDEGQVSVRSGGRRVRLTLEPADLVAALDWIELDGADGFKMPRSLYSRLCGAVRDAGW